MEKYLSIDIDKKIVIATLLLLLSMCISCGQVARDIHIGPPEREIRKLYQRAEAIYNGILEGDIASAPQNWDKAIRQFREIAKDYPNSRYADNAQYNLGLCYIWSYKIVDNSSTKAIEAFEYLIKRYPKSEFVDEAYYWKAYAYSLDKNYKRSIEEYEKFVNNYPKSSFRQEALSKIETFREIIGEPSKKTAEKSKDMDFPPSKKADETPKKDGAMIVKPSEKKIPSEKPITPKEPIVLETKKLDEIQKEPEKSEKIPDGMIHVKNIRFHSSPGCTRVVVDLTGSAEYSANRLKDPDRIFLDIQNTMANSAKKSFEINDGIIKLIRTSQFNANKTRVVLDVEQAHAYFVFHLTDPDRVVLDIYGSGGGNISPPKLTETETPKTEYQENKNLVKQLGLKVKTIVIDPGHGGKDPGAVSSSGTKEKTLVLDIAKRLKKMLENDGNYNVYLTRESDVYVELEKRTAFANDKNADLFISIHINASTKPKASGVETYYLSMASDEEAQATAALENASSGKTISELSSIIRYILRGAKIEESRELARTFQSHLARHSETSDRGVKRAPFIVLIGSNAPSILVELGFMSNPNDEKLLLRQEYREKLAKSLAEAIKAYIKTVDQSS